MTNEIKWYKASDGTPATAMDVSLVSQWLFTPSESLGSYVSWQVKWGAGATGRLIQQGSNNAGPVNDISCVVDDYSDLVSAGFQPSGTAGSLTIGRKRLNGAVRLKYIAASGTAAVPTGNVVY
jgi:hypothetical protein